MKHDGSTFLSGCAVTTRFFFFAKENDAVAAEGSPNSSFFCFDEDDEETPYIQYDESVGWPAIAMATSKPAGAERIVVAIGPNGDYWEMAPLSTDEVVGKIDDFSGNLRALGVVDGDIYACGMNRVVLRREGTGRWQSLGPGPRADDPDVVGFEDIGGFGKDEMYAVGWGGEIWWCASGVWRRVDSPTSTNLRALCCAPDGFVYVVGHAGTMLRGRRDQWAVIETERSENLMDVAWHDGVVYVVTNFRILKLVNGALVNDADFADAADLPATCLNLLQPPDGLISLGQKDVFRRSSGPWHRLV